MPALSTIAFSTIMALAHSQETSLKLQLVENTTCLDGSKAGYYYSPPAGATGELRPRTWVIHLEGGGGCSDQENCTKRAHNEYGSSNTWESELPCSKGTGWFLCSDQSRNPSFYNAHKVYVRYGTGDAHRGTRDTATPETWGLYFSGHINLQKILLDLEARYEMLSKAAYVLFTGGSAGAIGVYYNIDFIAGAVKNESAVVKAAPNAGFFFPKSWDCPALPEEPPSSYANFTAGVQCGAPTSANADVWKPIVSEACINDQKPGEEGACNSVSTAFKYIKSPVYILENQFDSNQIMDQMGCPRPTPANPQAYNYTSKYGQAMRDSLKEAMETGKSGDAVFSPSCAKHIVQNTVTVNNTEWPTLVADWFFERGAHTDSYRMIEECDESYNGQPCNAERDCQYRFKM